MHDMNDVISKNIVYLMNEQGITIVELSERSGVSISQIRRILSQSTNKKPAVLEKIAKGLEVSVIELAEERQ